MKKEAGILPAYLFIIKPKELRQIINKVFKALMLTNLVARPGFVFEQNAKMSAPT